MANGLNQGGGGVYHAYERPWKLTITLTASNFQGLKYICKQTAEQIVASKTHKELPTAGGGGGPDGSHASFSVTVEAPVEAQIKALRDEADRLEREAAEGKQ